MISESQGKVNHLSFEVNLKLTRDSGTQINQNILGFSVNIVDTYPRRKTNFNSCPRYITQRVSINNFGSALRG